MGDRFIYEDSSIDIPPSTSSPIQPSSSFSSQSASQGKRQRGSALLGGMLKPLSFGQVRFPARQVLLVSALLALVLCSNLLVNFPVVQPSTAFALAFKNPNPPIPTPAWLKPSNQPGKKPNLNTSAPAPATSTQPVSVPQLPQTVPMQPARLVLTSAAQHFVSSDGQLSVDIPADSLAASQLTQLGGVWLYITQVQPGSGGLDSEHLFFGSYAFQFFNAQGKALSALPLQHPFTLSYHLNKAQQPLVWQGQQIYALWNAVQTSATPPSLTAKTAVAPKAVSASQKPTLQYAQMDPTGTVWSVQSGFAASTLSSAATPAAQITLAAAAQPASTVTFGTEAPQAPWGKPQDFQVGLSGGSLNYTYPLSIPAGPGELTPPLSLTYSSAAVNGNHNLQATDPWVGQGWNLDLGQITWGEENVTPNGNPTEENVWSINDANGISGQLIPPDLDYSTIPTYDPSSPTSSEVWQVAPDSHVKVIELMYTGQPCWRVYLPGGIMEEFGCTTTSRQSYVDSAGDVVNWAWDLDLVTDRYGNQVHVSYQILHIGSGYSRDGVISDITYDDPTCHSSTTACGTWNPTVDLHFDASQSVVHLTNSGCGSGTSGQYRCDAPKDLSGSGGLAVPKVLNSYVLNDLKVEVQGNILREYTFSYDQGGPQQITDPSTGKQESIAGYLNLTQIQQEGTGGTTLNAPTTTIAYTKETEHYSDLITYATPTTNCSPYSNAPRDGNGACYLWSQSYNAYYITTLDNGEGWHEAITWQEAHSNTWGTDNGTNYNNALQCSSSQTSTNICGQADDENWSRVVVASRTASSNAVISTWSYSYYLTKVNASVPTNQPSRSCHGGCESYDWGNQNDDDFADYYNGTFEGFAQVQVVQPDGSSQTDTYGATNGWGLFSSSITCYTGGTCVAAPFNSSSGPVLAGQQLSEQDYDSGGNLLQQINWTASTNCPPLGVNGSVHAAGGSTDPGSGYLFSELDHNNPVLVCDPRVSQTDTYTTDGVTSNINDARVVHQTVHLSHDTNTCGNSGYDYGNVGSQDVSANDVGGVHSITETIFCPNDSLGSGIYLTDLPAKTYIQDQNGEQYGCATNLYGSNTSDLAQPSVPAVTATHDHTPYNGTTQNCIGAVDATLHSYDTSGNLLTTTDPDTHLGCTSGSSQYSACATYDGTFDTELLTATNAKNQTTSYGYTSTAAGGFSQWLTSVTDPNGQTTSYQYDALGRLTGIVEPGDSSGSPTVTYTYTNTCTAGSTTPCLELDTAVTYTSGGPVSTEKQWYDGWGHLVETQVPSPNSNDTIVTYDVYDSMNQQTTQSLPYAIATPAGYVAPDLTQARTVTAYDGLGRVLGSATYSNATTIVEEDSTSYTIAQGVPTISSESSTPYEQTITLDAYNHQSITYTDGFGRTRYTQIESGTASPYSVVRTVGYTYDMLNDPISATTYDSTGTAQASSNAVYDGINELLGYNDSDQGSCTDTPMPADCSGTTDTAWKFSYDADSNQAEPDRSAQREQLHQLRRAQPAPVQRALLR